MRAKIEAEQAARQASVHSKSPTEPAASAKAEDLTKSPEKPEDAEKDTAVEKTEVGQKAEGMAEESKDLSALPGAVFKKAQEDVINSNREEAKKRKQAKEEERSVKKTKVPP